MKKHSHLIGLVSMFAFLISGLSAADLAQANNASSTLSRAETARTLVGGTAVSVPTPISLIQAPIFSTQVLAPVSVSPTNQVLSPLPTTVQSPTINGGTFPATLTVGQVGTWTIIASDPANGPLSYSVNWGDAPFSSPGARIATAPIQQTSTFTHTYSSVGTYTISFVVSNNTGSKASSITTTVQVTSVTSTNIPTATVVGNPTLSLVYDNSQKQVGAQATFDVNFSAKKDTILYQNLSSVTFTSSVGDQPGYVAYAPGVVSVELGMKSDKYGRPYYVIPANRVFKVKVTSTIDTRKIFGGLYTASLQWFMVDNGSGPDNLVKVSLSRNVTNSKVIIGEVSPYITAVTASISAGQRMDITGRRLTGPQNLSQVYIDGVAVATSSPITGSVNGSSLSFTFPANISGGQHQIYVNSPTTGMSNTMYFQVIPTVYVPDLSVSNTRVSLGSPIIMQNTTVGYGATYSFTLTNNSNSDFSVSQNVGRFVSTLVTGMGSTTLLSESVTPAVVTSDVANVSYDIAPGTSRSFTLNGMIRGIQGQISQLKITGINYSSPTSTAGRTITSGLDALTLTASF